MPVQFVGHAKDERPNAPKYITGDDRMFRPMLSRTEQARIIAERVLQLSRGITILDENFLKKRGIGVREYERIASLELEMGELKMFQIVRILGDRRELWNINELEMQK